MRDSSVAPKERINVKFVPATGDQQEEVELPLKMVVLGDFTGQADDTMVEERKAVSVDKNSFASVLREMKLERNLEVRDALRDDPDATMSLKLKFESLQDFSPDAIIEQVPELKKLSDLREALTALKGPLGNLPAFRKALGEIIDDPEKREALLSELDGSKDEA
ncbi:type VI secretion system contractile sheath small subunit [Thalassospira xiamenensis]|jgi:type VI secretion system protein ImpB|uniref:Type VI secretion protein n=1 Tax=Thalassospira xiamenensis TaxID=220697 RepID=A0A367XHM9_9PROT|nr:type VI secretion system contractile sheath small subunit [Thalassospira xiamenensis]KZB51089.1 type VI secretion protein [Thalassospira xiamenensis]MCK2167799.1 type VI secretion system contractile sheath small subunit [Thalassospira xiamenensis]RCK53173.1 type VI secretion protein [Thalassospira xiamenensis]UKV13880.1 type VI secretion system contractile sheath small subunit [Thalassospiraceae bacterium SW-3-3]